MKSKKTPPADLENILPILISIWRRLHKEKGPLDRLQTREFRKVVESIQILQKEEKDTNAFDNPDLLGAYLLYHWVLHYQQALSILSEIPSTPRRVLDICSGPAPMAFAALRLGAKEVLATDKNIPALELGAEVAGRYGMPLTIRHWNPLKSSLPVEGTFDCIILGHCLEELFNKQSSGWEEKQNEFVFSLFKRLNPEGHLVLIENSLPQSNQRVLRLRDHLVSKGVPIQAPCVWRGQCPALQVANSPCYAQREMEKPHLIKELQRASQINLSSLKMSYVIFRNFEAGWPDTQGKRLYRIVSPPVQNHQGIAYYLCGTDGKKKLSSHLDKHPAASRAFEHLRRGELVSIENALENRNALEIIGETILKIEAACSRPCNL